MLRNGLFIIVLTKKNEHTGQNSEITLVLVTSIYLYSQRHEDVSPKQINDSIRIFAKLETIVQKREQANT